jgi:biotin carboxylase
MTQAQDRPTADTTALRRPSVLFLGGAGPVALSEAVVEPALLEGRASGVRTHIANKPDDLAGNTDALRALADAMSPVDFEHPDACVAWAQERLAAGERFDVVLGVREKAQRAVAEVAAALGVPGNPPEAVRRAQLKDACRARLAAAGFPQPEFRVCSGIKDALAFVGESRGPWIVKPRDAMGSLGVSLVREPGELPAAIGRLVDPGGAFLVEEFVEGPEYSVEGVFLGGRPRVLAVTGKETMEPPLFVEVAHVLPAVLPDGTGDEIERQVCAALTELGLVYGIFHVELWVTPRGIVLGEVHVRPGGDGIYLMLAHAIPGLELFRLVYDDALGRLADSGDLTPTRAAAVRFLMPPPGRLRSVEGWDGVRGHPGVLFAELTVRPGSVIRPVRESEDRVGLVIVGAEDSLAAQRLAAELVDSVTFVVEPVGCEPEHA